MKEWWLQLSASEKQKVLMGLALGLSLIIYFCLWQPLNQTVTSLRSQVSRQQELWAWMQEMDQKINATQHTQINVHEGKSFLGTVQTLLNKSPIAPKVNDLRQIENDTVQIRFKQASFDAMITWLIRLSETVSLQISEVSIKSTSAPGIVDAEITLNVIVI